jgi:hypothetical protein
LNLLLDVFIKGFDITISEIDSLGGD